MIEFDKVYQSLKQVSAEWHAGHVEYYFFWDYLKFYHDGTVIKSSNNSNNISILNNWFYKDNNQAQFNKGTFTIKNNKILINIPVAIGSLSIEGEINNNNLILLSKNDKMNHFSWNFYASVS